MPPTKFSEIEINVRGMHHEKKNYNNKKVCRNLDIDRSP